MKKTLFETSYKPFLITGLVAAAIAIFLKVIHPEANFSISIYNSDYTQSQYKIWLWFAIYFTCLAGIYLIIYRNKLKTKRWLIISHYIFIILFLVFYTLFSIFGSRDMQALMPNISITTFITIYGIIFLIDAVMFLMGVIFLFINLSSALRKK